jgi:hypothetical protein
LADGTDAGLNANLDDVGVELFPGFLEKVVAAN